MEDTLKSQLYSLLGHVRTEIKKHKKHRHQLTIEGDLHHLVGMVEFQDITTLMITKLFLEYNTSDYTFKRNNNLYRREGHRYLPYSDHCLEIISPEKKNKVKSFLKFLRVAEKNLDTWLSNLRRDWIRVVDIGFVTYLRKNVYFAHKDPISLYHPILNAMSEFCRGEDVFWRHVLVLLGLEPSVNLASLGNQEISRQGTFNISHGNASDGNAWNFILITPNYRSIVENKLGLVSSEAKTIEDVVGVPELAAGQKTKDSYTDTSSSEDEIF